MERLKRSGFATIRFLILSFATICAISMARVLFLFWVYLSSDARLNTADITGAFLEPLGALAIGIGVFFTYRRAALMEQQISNAEKRHKAELDETRKQNEAGRQQHREDLAVAREGQVNDRFSKAIEHLGNDELHIRLGGIYALEQIAKEFPDENHQTVLEVLCAFLRTPKKYDRREAAEGTKQGENEFLQFRAPADVQAAFTVICRRDDEWEEENLPDFLLDLVDVNLFRVANPKAKLHRVYLFGVNLRDSLLTDADLRNTVLRNSNLSKALLRDANLCEANLEKAIVEDANFTGVNLEGANLKGVDFSKVEPGMTLDQFPDELPEGMTLPSYLQGEHEAAPAENEDEHPEGHAVDDLPAE